MHRGLRVSCVSALVAAFMLVAVSAAQATTPSSLISSGGPLSNIWIGNELSCQVGDAGNSAEFYPHAPGPGDCGTFLHFDTGTATLFGPDFGNHPGTTAASAGNTAFTPVSQSVSGNTVTTVVSANSGTATAAVTEVDTYVPGQDFYTTTITVRNTSVSASFGGHIYHAGDCYLRGVDQGYGVLDTSGQNPVLGCTVTPNNSPASAVQEFQPQTGGASYTVNAFSTVWSEIAAQSNLSNDCPVCTSQADNGMGVGWAFSALAPQATQTFVLRTQIDDAGIQAHGGFTFSGRPGQSVGGTVATFTNSDSSTTASSYQAKIAWGDGNSDAGTVTGGGGSYTVTGNHAYAASGSYAITVTITFTGSVDAGSAVTDSAAITGPPAPSGTQTPTVSNSGAAFAGTVKPNGLPTTAHFEYGLDPKYGPQTGGQYANSTSSQGYGGDFADHGISAQVGGLAHDAVYHVRLVATNSAGTSFGPDLTFTTPKAPAPPPPVLGKTFNLTPVSGIVLVNTSHGFVPLTQLTQIGIGTQIDALKGSLNLTAANAPTGTTAAKHPRKKAKPKPKPYTGTFGGAVFKVGQARAGSSRGFTTLTLVEGAFRGAPTYASCPKRAADVSARTARLSGRVLQTLRGRDHGGRFTSRGRYSAATVLGTVWTTSDRCDGTWIKVQSGAVSVRDFVKRITLILHAGQTHHAAPKHL